MAVFTINQEKGFHVGECGDCHDVLVTSAVERLPAFMRTHRCADRAWTDADDFTAGLPLEDPRGVPV